MSFSIILNRINTEVEGCPFVHVLSFMHTLCIKLEPVSDCLFLLRNRSALWEKMLPKIGERELVFSSWFDLYMGQKLSIEFLAGITRSEHNGIMSPQVIEFYFTFNVKSLKLLFIVFINMQC